ncbi:MAG: hypothetical protein GY866_43565, partial [Proteobacteria bacterium]|nr:hypothetical protein [Pseudomonadota bacterium]
MKNSEIQVRNSNSVLSTEKSRLKAILAIALPVVAASLGDNLNGPIDTAMVGRLGDVALASTAVGNALFFLMLTIAMGLGAGVQALVARRVGEDNTRLAGYDLNAGILIGGLTGFALMILGYCIFPFFVSLMNQDPEVVARAVAYLRARLPSMVFFGLALSFPAYWNGTSMSKMLLPVMTMSLLSNILFNYLLIFGNFGFPRMEVAGAGLASTLASLCALTTHFVLGLKYARKNGFLQGLPDRERIRTMVGVSIPISVVLFFMFLAGAVILFIVGLLGTKVVAAY